jgi:plastocyanin
MDRPRIALLPVGAVVLAVALVAGGSPGKPSSPGLTETATAAFPSAVSGSPAFSGGGADVAVGCAMSWNSAPTPSPGGDNNFLRGVVALSANNVWAVGSAQISRYLTLIQHWDGSSWTIVPSPNIGPAGNYLYAVDAVSAFNIWAVGAVLNDGTLRHRTLILHYDGSTWTTVPSPNVGIGHNYLHGIEVISATDIWAVGHYVEEGGFVGTLILHYDGSTWSVVPSPNPGMSGNYLYGISATGPNDLWAVGATYVPSWRNLQTLALHYDGSSWTAAPTPNLGQDTANHLLDVESTSPTEAWAVGFANGTETFDTHILQWNGSTWSTMPTSGRGGRLFGVDAVAKDDVWAVGATLIEHWDGVSWKAVIPASALADGFLFGVSALPTGQVHAVGYEAGKEDPVGGNVCETAVTDTGFSTEQGIVGLGTTAAWTFPPSNAGNHRVVAQGLGLFDSGARPPGSSYTFTFQGAGIYTVKDPPTADLMQVRVAPTAVPLAGNESTQFTITWAKAAIPGFVFDVQIRRPGLGWQDWKVDVATLSGRFTPDAGPGQYSFRARIQNVSTSRTSAYSPRVTITVT